MPKFISTSINEGRRSNTGRVKQRFWARSLLAGFLFINAAMVIIAPCVGNQAASAVEPVLPQNPDRGVLPIISGSKVLGPESYGSCSAGAVLIPSAWYSRLTPYQRATRWVVIAKHCAPMYASIHVGARSIGNVVWQSAASDIELVRVSPEPENMRAVCVGSSHPEVCVLHPRYRPLANNRVFVSAGGGEARMPVSGWQDAPDDERFCISAWRSGVKCLFSKMTLVPGMYQGPHQHLLAAASNRINSVAPGDSGGPALTTDRHLVGIISSGLGTERLPRYGFYYTPMRQVMQELHAYTLGPADIPSAEDEDNPLSLSDAGSDAGWALAPDIEE
nr:trypsin-like serine protease [Curtobacterium flaccumfaciens pv. poinsettiae]